MNHPRTVIFLICWITAGLRAPVSTADVIVIANQTASPVEFRIAMADGHVQPHQLPAGGQTVIESEGSAEILYDIPGRVVRFRLDANSANFFARNAEDWLELQKIQLGGDPSTFAGRPLPAPQPGTEDVARIPVMILVDHDVPVTRQIWEPRIRKRVATVSDILERTCRVRLEVVAAGQWESSQELQDVHLLLREFQQQVDPRPARLAIGFSSRIHHTTAEYHLGGSPGLLERHLLVKE
jgi:hypothetical protein